MFTFGSLILLKTLPTFDPALAGPCADGVQGVCDGCVVGVPGMEKRGEIQQCVWLCECGRETETAWKHALAPALLFFLVVMRLFADTLSVLLSLFLAHAYTRMPLFTIQGGVRV